MKAEAEVAYVANVQDPLAFKNVVPQPQLELEALAPGRLFEQDL